MRKALLALAALAVIATPALAKKERTAVTTGQQPTGKWCETENPDNLATDIWQNFKRGNCKITDDSEESWIVFTTDGYREPRTTCKITSQRRGKNWLLYHCTVEGDTEDRIHKWGIDPKTGMLSWGTLDDEEED